MIWYVHALSATLEAMLIVARLQMMAGPYDFSTTATLSGI